MCDFTLPLYLLGYRWAKIVPSTTYIESNFLNNSDNKETIIIVQEDNNPPIINYVNIDTNNTCKSVLNVLYTFIMGSIIIHPFVLSIIKSIVEKESSYLLQNLFQLLFFVQFIFGNLYFSKNHLIEKIKRPQIISQYYSSILLGFILSILVGLTYLILNILDYKILGYYEFYNQTSTYSKALMSLLIFIEKFFSYLSFFTNLITFTLIMKYHQEFIETYSAQLQNIIISSMDELIIKVINDFTNMRIDFKNTIEELNNIFSSFNFIGIIAIYFTLNNINYNYINIIIFLVIESIYIWSIYKVRSSVDNIINNFSSPFFIAQILSNKKSLSENQIFNSSSSSSSSRTNSNNLVTFDIMNTLIASNNKEATHYLILCTTLGIEWETFRIFGFPITDASILQKLLAYFVGYLLASDIGDMFK